MVLLTEKNVCFSLCDIYVINNLPNMFIRKKTIVLQSYRNYE